MNMKKLFCILFCSIVASVSAVAQTQTFDLIYLTKDYTTEVGPLCREIMDIYDSAIKDRSQAVIFYLANSKSPIIVKINLPGDNRGDISKITEALISKSETVINPAIDLNKFAEIFDENELLDQNGQPTFISANIQYYITPTFWELQYNEQLIASAYFAFGMDSPWAEGYFTMSIYHNANDGLTINEEQPFGPKNLCNGYKLFLLTYSE